MTRVRVFVETLHNGDLPSFDFPPDYCGKVLVLTEKEHVHQVDLPKSRRIVCPECEDGDHDLAALRTRIIEAVLTLATVAGDDGSAVVCVRSSYVLSVSLDPRPFHIFSYSLMFASGVEPDRDEPVHTWIPRTVWDPASMLGQVPALMAVTEVLQS